MGIRCASSLTGVWTVGSCCVLDHDPDGGAFNPAPDSTGVFRFFKDTSSCPLTYPRSSCAQQSLPGSHNVCLSFK
ncbi:hypothetical protein AcV7_005680 [Taiwanofungus camphoratus]|nr:hypothetical protein AcV7_005680 [Antrodia cinnamomea]